MNLLLWLLLCCFVIQPTFDVPLNANRVLVFSENIPKTVVQKAKDSLQINESFSVRDFNTLSDEDVSFVDKLGKIYLIGNEFNSLIINKLTNKNIDWIPFSEPDVLQKITWKGILRKGEIQEIKGKIIASESKFMKVNFGEKTLDSVLLKKGLNDFSLKFPSFSIGKTETELFFDDKSLQKITFYSRKPQPIKVLFILENPDFEAKTLSEWLGKNGNQVELQTSVAKNTKSKISINITDPKSRKEADIVITDPSNVKNQLVKNALSEGKSVLFFNLTKPEEEIKSINLALGTKWQIKKISAEENIKINENLTAFPYNFVEKDFQKIIPNYQISIQKTYNRIGLSLLNETFPLKLSGDSLTYAKIWTSVFQQLNPDFNDNIEIEAPIFQDTETQILLNNLSNSIQKVKVENDVISTRNLLVNPASLTANYVFRKPDWQPFQDSLEVFVEKAESPLANVNQIENFLKIQSKFNAQNLSNSVQNLKKRIPDWFWFLMIIICLSAIWIEPKLSF